VSRATAALVMPNRRLMVRMPTPSPIKIEAWVGRRSWNLTRGSFFARQIRRQSRLGSSGDTRPPSVGPKIQVWA
jgi:hypothetical protein